MLLPLFCALDVVGRGDVQLERGLNLHEAVARVGDEFFGPVFTWDFARGCRAVGVHSFLFFMFALARLFIVVALDVPPEGRIAAVAEVDLLGGL